MEPQIYVKATDGKNSVMFDPRAVRSLGVRQTKAGTYRLYFDLERENVSVTRPTEEAHLVWSVEYYDDEAIASATPCSNRRRVKYEDDE